MGGKIDSLEMQKNERSFYWYEWALNQQLSGGMKKITNYFKFMSGMEYYYRHVHDIP
jgi:hypothetical protein